MPPTLRLTVVSNPLASNSATSTAPPPLPGLAETSSMVSNPPADNAGILVVMTAWRSEPSLCVAIASIWTIKPVPPPPAVRAASVAPAGTWPGAKTWPKVTGTSPWLFPATLITLALTIVLPIGNWTSSASIVTEPGPLFRRPSLTTRLIA